MRRSPLEIQHRFAQEVRNLRLLLLPPSVELSTAHLSGELLPKPAWLNATPFANNIRELAGRILSHQFPLFSTEIATGPNIEWRRDYVNNKSTGRSYFRMIPYLDIHRAGDHKWIWELNRHQHLVVLAQAFLFFDDRACVQEIERELRSWMEQNPFQRGINWSSALEVAFRAMSWLWVLHLTGPQLSGDLRRSMLEGLYHHGLHIENNLSFYFSPNTHLLGEAVALHALAVVLPGLPSAAKWQQKAGQVVEEQMHAQVRDDGSHFEQSTYYHVYALDMFLFHAVLSNPSSAYRAKLGRMADYLDALLGPDRRLPFLGDDDGGRWFHPYGDRAAFGCATLATANTWFGENRWACQESDYWEQACWWLPSASVNTPLAISTQSQMFADAGTAVLQSPGTKIIVDCGPFGCGSGGHSHADTLSLTVTADRHEILIDPGTFTYVGNGKDRNSFRGTAAHNTVRIDKLDQADPVNLFRWANPPAASVITWRTSDTEDILEAECAYRGLRHRRYFHFVKPFALLIVDTISGPPGDHIVEQFWHLAAELDTNRLRIPTPVERQNDWRSRCFTERESAPVLVATAHTSLPAVMPAGIRLSEETEIDIAFEPGSVHFMVTFKPENRQIFVNYAPDLR